jgi:hypothetical protein
MGRHPDRVVRLAAWEQPAAMKPGAAMQVVELRALCPQSAPVAAVEQQGVLRMRDEAECRAQRQGQGEAVLLATWEEAADRHRTPDQAV